MPAAGRLRGITTLGAERQSWDDWAGVMWLVRPGGPDLNTYNMVRGSISLTQFLRDLAQSGSNTDLYGIRKDLDALNPLKAQHIGGLEHVLQYFQPRVASAFSHCPSPHSPPALPTDICAALQLCIHFWCFPHSNHPTHVKLASTPLRPATFSPGFLLACSLISFILVLR